MGLVLGVLDMTGALGGAFGGSSPEFAVESLEFLPDSSKFSEQL
jgi:hypothetical protein